MNLTMDEFHEEVGPTEVGSKIPSKYSVPTARVNEANDYVAGDLSRAAASAADIASAIPRDDRKIRAASGHPGFDLKGVLSLGAPEIVGRVALALGKLVTGEDKAELNGLVDTIQSTSRKDWLDTWSPPGADTVATQAPMVNIGLHTEATGSEEHIESEEGGALTPEDLRGPSDLRASIDKKLQMDFVPARQSHEVSAEYGKGRLPMRANNPGAIKWVSNEKAQFEDTVGKTEGDAGDFAVYGTPEAGFEALSNLLDTHVYRYPEETKGTVAGVINRHAPTSENVTSAYVEGMRDTLKAFGVSADGDKFDSRDPKQHAAFLIGMASIESDRPFPWSKESLIEGMRGAGQQQDRDVPMFSTEEIDDLEKNLSIDRKDGETTVTLYGIERTVGRRGAKA